VTARVWKADQYNARDEVRGLRTMLAALLVLVLATNLLSAWLRHGEAGIGCTPWPECYAQLAPESATLSPQPVATALQPPQIIKQLHRAIAMVLVVMVLLIIHQARRQRSTTSFDAVLPYALGAVTLLLAVVGPASYLKTRPGIAATNLLGGMLMLAVTWRMLLGAWSSASNRNSNIPRALVLVALGALSLQIALGAWASANFAGTACARAFACAVPDDGSVSPAAFWYLRELPVDAFGRAVIGADAWLIQHAHRAGAWASAAVIVYLGLTLLRQRVLPLHGAALASLVGLQIVLGLVLVTRDLPMAAVLAHLLLATLLLLVLLDLAYRSQRHERQ
jgi:heme a synthase